MRCPGSSKPHDPGHFIVIFRISGISSMSTSEGLVALRAGETDHREKNVHLTLKGKQYAKELLASSFVWKL